MTKEKEWGRHGDSRRFSEGPGKYAAIGHGTVQPCFDHEGEAKYGTMRKTLERAVPTTQSSHRQLRSVAGLGFWRVALCVGHHPHADEWKKIFQALRKVEQAVGATTVFCDECKSTCHTGEQKTNQGQGTT